MMNIFDKKKKVFPPVPEWKPAFNSNPEEVIDIFKYYSNNQKDFVVFNHLTVVLIEDGLDNKNAVENAVETLNKIYNYHPDMMPQLMDDGNILVSYEHPAYNIAVEKTAQRYWSEIEANHLRALCTSEVLITPLGPNKFDDFGKKALWARCYFFMDAQDPKVLRVVRKSA
jgi:hypothetical protein